MAREDVLRAHELGVLRTGECVRLRLGTGAVKMADAWEDGGKAAGGVFALCDGPGESDAPCAAPRPVDGAVFAEIVTDSAEALDVLISKLEAARAHLTSGPGAGTALTLVARERQRQVLEEGWSPAWDDGYVRGELPKAAACYAVNVINPAGGESSAPSDWPFMYHWWKPTTPLRDLTKAGALILAEIERLMRKGKDL